MRKLFNLLALIIIIIASSQPADAVPARSQPIEIAQPDGTTITLVKRGDEWCHWMSDLEGNLMLLDRDGFYRRATQEQIEEWKKAATERKKLREREILDHVSQPQQATRSGSGSHFSFPSKGTIRGLVVLVEYADVRFSIDDPYQHFYDMLNKPGYNYSSGKYTHIGSARDYFYDNSLGQFDPQFDVYGPVLLSHDRAHYGGNDENGNDLRPREMVTEACEILDSQGVDFSQYDVDNNGEVDFVFVFYAGEGEQNNNATSDAVWPHQWFIAGNHIHDGKRLWNYACANELDKNRLEGIGSFCHEFSHVLGLRDLYDVQNNLKANGPKYYSLLDAGENRGNGYCPVGLSSYERYELGWLTPIPLPEEPASLQLKEFGTSNEAYIYQVSSSAEFPDSRDGEYYLFENRQKTKWDAYLPGHGMVVWHIDFSRGVWNNNKVNTWADHPCVDLIEADGYKEKQDGSETFPGIAGHTEFTDDTTPAFSGWSFPRTEKTELGYRLGLPITNIRELSGVLAFDVLGGLEGIDDIIVKSSTEYYTPYGVKDLHPTSGFYIVYEKGKNNKVMIVK